MLKKLIIPAVLVLCAACQPEGDVPGAEAQATATTAPLSGGAVIASIPFATEAERSARQAEIRNRLGPEWELRWNSAEQLQPTLALGWQPSVRGNKTAAEIQDIATRFLAANADILGLTQADLDAQSFVLESVDGGRFWRWSGGTVRLTPGFEQFPGLQRRLSTHVEVWSDGTVTAFGSQGQELPPLQMDVTPALSDASPLVRGKVIGHEVSAIENPPSPFVTCPTREIGKGPVRASDIKGITLDVVLNRNDAQQRNDLRLVYVFKVVKFENNEFTFWVDANTGELLNAEDTATVLTWGGNDGCGG